jgi:hypothetical protein
MKKVLFPLLSILFLYSCETPKVKSVEEKWCLIDSVKFYPTGTIHTLQLDPVWKGTTECGIEFSSRREMSVGDTFYYKIITLEK